MDVNGLKLPHAFVRAVTQDVFSNRDVLRPRDSADVTGHPLNLDLAQLYTAEATLRRATMRVVIGFEPDAWYGARVVSMPGGIPDIVDFSHIVCFGSSGEGEPFCFDFRDDSTRPSVICWDGDALSWRRIAPDFEAFVELFGIGVKEHQEDSDA